jgi:excisionase family DNA binding protein
MLTPREVAKRLRCSEWWVKEQARKRRIPFSWIGGSYRFTEEHVHEVIQLFEHRPAGAAFSGTDAVASLSPARVRKPPPAARLKARSPRRAIRAAPPSTEA